MQLRKRCRRKLIINNCGNAVCLIRIGRIIYSRWKQVRCPDGRTFYQEEVRREERWLEKK